MSDQQHGDRGAGGTGEDLDPPLESEVTSEVLSGGAGASGEDASAGGSDAAERGGSSADETSPGSDGDGAEAGYTAPGELETDPEPVEPTD
jgi:hypothetical protein